MIENYPCNTKDELLARERYFIESMKCVNKYIPHRTRKEHIKYHEVYRAKHKHKMLVYSKQYREKHKHKISKKSKELYLKNKDLINKRQSCKHMCGCGIVHTYSHKARHIHSQRHQEYYKLLKFCTDFMKQYKASKTT